MRRRIHCGGNLFDMQFHNRPSRSAQHHKRDATALKVLLIANVLVGGNERVEPSFLGNGQQVAVPILDLSTS
jgi:hypothetical protein